MEKVSKMASENGVLVFTKSTCCLCYTINVLFHRLGIKPTIHEIDQDPNEKEIERALLRLGCTTPVPIVFIGGKLVGSTNEVMSLHLSGLLNPMIKPYQPTIS